MEKEKMKKNLILGLVILVVVTLIFVTPGAAAGIEIESDEFDQTYKNYTHSNVPVLLTLSHYFEVTLPVSFTFDDPDGDRVYTSSDSVILTVGRLNTTEYVQINMSSNNYTADIVSGKSYWNLTNDESAVEYYEVALSESQGIHLGEVSNRLRSGDPVLRNSTSDTNFIHMKLVNSGDKLVETGVFRDVLTFEVSVLNGEFTYIDTAENSP